MSNSAAVEFIKDKVSEESGLYLLGKIPYLSVITEEIFNTKIFTVGIVPHKKILYIKLNNLDKKSINLAMSDDKYIKIKDVLPKMLGIDYSIKFVVRFPTNINIQEVSFDKTKICSTSS